MALHRHYIVMVFAAFLFMYMTKEMGLTGSEHNDSIRFGAILAILLITINCIGEIHFGKSWDYLCTIYVVISIYADIEYIEKKWKNK